ncbi:DUF58 domain-containing protein [Calidifontibacillus erzurumensis]|uniref:DUF58 domain-containing protein n=1 Tax=Calidifontibacillus erzurumensis TaxID=2741433 RepID=A0A8J8GJ94_9BACI|nr:DUF58 domain-containing protein [Calidifontibacillus erzurumensis]NSL53330.1 DUF58 domain-containing protein [Calidifontibacillus erzurumensis]
MSTLFNRLKLSGKVLLLLIGLGALYAFAMFQGGFVSWFLLYSFSPFIIYSLIFAMYPFSFWKVERILEHQKKYEAGDSLTVQIHLSRRLPFPLYFLIVTDNYSGNFPEKQGQKKLMLFPLFKRKITVTYEIAHLPRGELVFEDLTIVSGDFFGFINKKHQFQTKSKVVVYPKKQRINPLFLKTQVGEGRLSRRFDYKKETMVPSGIREYQRGDRLSWINWKMTAKKSKLISKEFEVNEDQNYCIWLDRSMLINHDAFEKMVVFAASLVDELTKTGCPVQLISIGKDKDSSIFSLKRTSESHGELFYHLAVAQNDAPKLLKQAVEKEKKVLPEKGTIIFVTEKMDPQFLQWTKRIASSQRRIAIILAAKQGVLNYSAHLSKQNIMIKTIDEDFGFERTWVQSVGYEKSFS